MNFDVPSPEHIGSGLQSTSQVVELHETSKSSFSTNKRRESTYEPPESAVFREDGSRSEDNEGDAIHCPTYDNRGPTAASEDCVGGPGAGKHQENDDRRKASSVIIWTGYQSCENDQSDVCIRTNLWDGEGAWFPDIPRLKP